MFEQLLTISRPITSVDPFSANVVFAMNMDGTHGGAIFTEKYGTTITAIGCTTSNVRTKFGPTSCRVSTNAAYLATSNQSGLFDFVGDFTVDFWYYYIPTEISTFNTFFDIGGQSLSCQIASTSSKIIIYSGIDGSMNDTIGIAHNLVANSWNHMVIQRTNKTYYLGINGTLTTYKTSATVSNLVADKRYAFTIGNYSVSKSYGIGGYLDDFRITKGVARYVGPTYVVPTSSII